MLAVFLILQVFYYNQSDFSLISGYFHEKTSKWDFTSTNNVPVLDYQTFNA